VQQSLGTNIQRGVYGENANYPPQNFTIFSTAFYKPDIVVVVIDVNAEILADRETFLMIFCFDAPAHKTHYSRQTSKESRKTIRVALGSFLFSMQTKYRLDIDSVRPPDFGQK